MFDYVHININNLPISEEEKKQLGKNPGFQTKYFDCILTSIRITDSGELEIDRFEYGWDEEATNGFGTKGGLTRENERAEKIPFHGCFNFYTYNRRDEWVEFAAKFTNGRLVEIVHVKDTL